MIKLLINRFDDDIPVSVSVDGDVSKLENKLDKLQSKIKDVMQNFANADAESNLKRIESQLDKISSKIKSNYPNNLDLNQKLRNTKGSYTKTKNKYKAYNDQNQNFPSVKSFLTDFSKITDSINDSTVAVVNFNRQLTRTGKLIGEFVISQAEAAGDYIEAVNLYKMAVGQFGDAGSEWADKIADALYLDKAEILQYTGEFFNLTKGLGVTAEAADLMSRNLTQLSYDMSSYLNIGVSSAQDKLLSAMSGQTKAVTSVGIAVQQASLQELAYQLGIEKSVQNMTQAEKTYLRYIQIMRSTTQMQGDLGRTIITPTNAIRLLRTQISLLGRAVGEIFIPIIMKAIPYLVALTEMAKAAAQSIAALLGFNMKDFEASSDGIISVSDAFEDMSDKANGARSSINRTLAAFDDLNVVENRSKGSGGGIEFDAGDWSKLLSGYDMLKDYTSKIKDQVAEAKKQLEKMVPILKTVGVVVGGLVIIGKLAKIISNISIIKGAISGINTAMNTGALGKFLKNKAPWLSTLGKGVARILSAYAGIKLMESGAKSMEKAFDKAGNSFSGLGTAIGGTLKSVAGGALAGTAILPGLGTVIGAAAGGLSSVISMLTAYKNKMDELHQQELENNIFGNLSISVEEFSEMLTNKLPASLTEFDALMQQHNSTIKSLGDEYTNNANALDTYLYKFGYLGEQISGEQGQLLLDSIQSTFKSANDIIDESTSYSLDIYTQAFKNGTSLTKEEQQSILDAIQKGGDNQKSELRTTQDKITSIYDNAIKTRGYLTDEEYKTIQAMLDKIRKLTEGNLTESGSKILRISQKYSDEKLTMDKESYENLKKAVAAYDKEAEEKAEKHYFTLAQQAQKYRDDGTYNEEQYRNALKAAQEAYDKDIKDAAVAKSEYLKGIEDEIIEKYKTATGEEKELLRSLFSDVIQHADIEKFEDSGEACFNKFIDGAEACIKSRPLYMCVIPKLSNSKLTVSVEGQASYAPGYQNNKPYQFPGSLSRGYASGGYPDRGDYFFANENGRAEYVGSIGGKTAVANQDQLVQAIASAAAAIAGNTNNSNKQHLTVQIGSKTLYDGQIEYQNSQITKYGTSKFLQI